MLDVVFRGGQVIDGTGSPAYQADVAVAGDRIAAIGTLAPVESARQVDISGLTIAPGFIDPHVHSEVGLLAGTCGAAAVQQGVTTHVLTPDGFGYAPLSRPRLNEMKHYLASFYGEPEIGWDWSSLGEYLERFDGQVPVNVVAQVSHHAVRLEVMGWDERAPTAAELDQMAALTCRSMEEGAVALAVGLDYLPGAYSQTDELVALCRVVAARGGLYTAHQRHGRGGVVAATQETLDIAAATGIAVHISHLYGEPDLFGQLERAREAGTDVTFDSYPYTAGATALMFYLPQSVQTGTPAEIAERLKELSVRNQVCMALSEKLRPPDQWDSYLISGVGAGPNKHLQGRSLAEIAGTNPQSLADFICDLLVEENLNVLLIDFWLDEVKVTRSLTHPLQMVMSDGIFLSYPHPRGFGTFPRVLGEYARERGILSMEDAVQRMTSIPARRFHLHDRGLLKPGLAADLTIFDHKTVLDGATYQEPEQPPIGIVFVTVNGEFVVDNGRVTGATPGRVLKPLL